MSSVVIAQRIPCGAERSEIAGASNGVVEEESL